MLGVDLSISAVIPLYNGAGFITAALDSVYAQDVLPDEVIVVDDGSTDDGPSIVRQYAGTPPLILLRKENGGQSSARNFGIRHASGTLIALLDQDDLWYPHHLRELVRPFQQEPSRRIGWTYSNLDEIGCDGQLRGRSVLDACTTDHPKIDLATCLREDMFILPSASLILRAAIEEVGYFDEQLSGYEDDDLFLRMFVAGYHNVYISEALGQWRIYAASSSYSRRMAISRMVYARKLLDAFPDQPVLGRYDSSKLLAPRFLKQAVDEARTALSRGDTAIAGMCLADIEYLERKIAPVAPPHPLRDRLLVTAVVLLRDGAATIRESLHSVQQQSRAVDEIVVVDDGSSDDGPQIVQDLAIDRRIRLITKPPGTQAAARNAGVRAAHGDVVAFLDQGDRWHFDHVEVLLDPFRELRPVELAWTCGDVSEIEADGATARRHRSLAQEGPQPKRTLADCLAHEMLVMPSAAMLSRKAYWAVGGCDERLDVFEDDDLFVRLFKAGYENFHVKHPVTARRRQRSPALDNAQISASRMLYLQKLVDGLPTAPQQGARYVPDVVAPRFFRAMLTDVRIAILGDAPSRQEQAVANLAYVIRLLSPERRSFYATFLLPLLRYRATARLLMRYRIAISRLVHRIVPL